MTVVLFTYGGYFEHISCRYSLGHCLWAQDYQCESTSDSIKPGIGLHSEGDTVGLVFKRT